MDNKAIILLFLLLVAMTGKGISIDQETGPGTTAKPILPEQPKNTKSAEWVKWVQKVIYLSGGFRQSMLLTGGVFRDHSPPAIIAAAFGNYNYYDTPWKFVPGVDIRNPGRYQGLYSPFYFGE